MASSESELEVPYALNFSEDDDSSVGFDSPGKEEVHREPIRAGDILSYTNPVYTVGNPEGARKAVVLKVDSSRLYPLVLDNAEHLPLDTRVQRIAIVSSKGQVSPHPGRCKPIESFQLKDSGDTELSEVLLERAHKLRRNMADLEAKAVHAYVHGVASASGQGSRTRRTRASVPSTTPTDDSHSASPTSLGDGATASSPDSDFLENLQSKQDTRRQRRQKKKSGENSSDSDESSQFLDDFVRRPKATASETAGTSTRNTRCTSPPANQSATPKTVAKANVGSGKGRGLFSNLFNKVQRSASTNGGNSNRTSDSTSNSSTDRRTSKNRATATSDHRHSTPSSTSKLSDKAKDRKISDFFSSLSSRKKRPKIDNNSEASTTTSTAEREWSESSIPKKSKKHVSSSMARQKRTSITPLHRPILQLRYGSPKEQEVSERATTSNTPVLCDSSKKSAFSRPTNQGSSRFLAASQSSSSCTNITSPQASQDFVSPTMSSQPTRSTLGSGGGTTTEEGSERRRQPNSREQQEHNRRTSTTRRSEGYLLDDEEESHATNPTADTFGSSASSTRKDLFQARDWGKQQTITNSSSSGRHALLSTSSEESSGGISGSGDRKIKEQFMTNTSKSAAVVKSRSPTPTTQTTPNSKRKRRIQCSSPESSSESDSSSLSLKAPKDRARRSPRSSPSAGKKEIVSKRNENKSLSIAEQARSDSDSDIEEMLRSIKKRSPAGKPSSIVKQRRPTKHEDEAEEQDDVLNGRGIAGVNSRQQRQPFKRQRLEEAERTNPPVGDNHLTASASKERQVLKDIMQMPIPRKADRAKVLSNHEKKHHHRDALHHHLSVLKKTQEARPNASLKQQTLTSVFDFVDEKSPRFKQKR